MSTVRVPADVFDEARPAPDPVPETPPETPIGRTPDESMPETTAAAEPSPFFVEPPPAAAPVAAPVAASVIVPPVMEPATAPEGFVRVQTGPNRSAWVAAGAPAALSHASYGGGAVHPVALPSPEPLPEPVPVVPQAAVVSQPMAAAPEAVISAPPIVVPIPVTVPIQIPVPVTVRQYAPPAPVYQQPVRQRATVVAPARRRASSSPEPYLRDY